MKNRIKDIREIEGISRQDLADKMAVSTATITYWEKNLKQPTLEKLIELSKIFETSIEHILGEDVSLYDVLNIHTFSSFSEKKFGEGFSEEDYKKGVKIEYSIHSEAEYDNLLKLRNLSNDESYILNIIHNLSAQQINEVKELIASFK